MKMKSKFTLIILSALFVTLMSLPWLVPGLGFLSLIGIVPLLCIEKIASSISLKRFWIWYFSLFLLWNLATTWWVCVATVGGGIFASLANAFQMSLIFAVFRLSKKRFSGALPYIFLMVMWIAWERFYFGAQISWPWITLGHAFARTVSLVQWYDTTGVLGGSLWVWASNLAVFDLMSVLADGSWWGRFNAKARVAALVGVVAVLFGPMIWSSVKWNSFEETDKPFKVLITQPDIDPYYKYGHLTQAQQDELLIHLVDSTLTGSASELSFGLPRHDGTVEVSSTEALTSRNNGNESSAISLTESPDTYSEELDSAAFAAGTPLLILAPETFNGGLVTNALQSNRSWETYSGLLRKYPGSSLIFGASTYDFITAMMAPTYTARSAGDGVWRESHNSAVLIDGEGHGQIYHKTKLVVGTEFMPYPKFFSKLDDKLGGVMGRCVGQKEVTCLKYHSADGSMTVPIGTAVCYESVYGEHCIEYVRKGAQALAVITNDVWWGNTAGHKQHCSYSSLRAIETRRDIARSANSGISCIINQRGEILESRGWWERSTILADINLNDAITPFVKYGDITGRVCTLLFLLILGSLIVRLLTKRKK